MKPLLEVKGLAVSYGDAGALWDISFGVPAGAIVALVGANGAGKTTVLNTVSGLLRPRAGAIRWDGRDLAGLGPEEIVAMGISQVPEGRRLFSRLTVLENLELGAFPRRARGAFGDSLGRVFALFPVLERRLGQSAGSLSGGEQQMLAIGRAIMARPLLLMLDEPSLGLAPVMVKTMFAVIRSLNREGTTILLVEQNVHQTLEIAHYAYVLKAGHMALEGNGPDLLGNPEFQQAYLGRVH